MWELRAFQLGSIQRWFWVWMAFEKRCEWCDER